MDSFKDKAAIVGIGETGLDYYRLPEGHEADMKKLREAGYTKPFYSLEEGISDYVKVYLSTEKYL